MEKNMDQSNNQDHAYKGSATVKLDSLQYSNRKIDLFSDENTSIINTADVNSEATWISRKFGKCVRFIPDNMQCFDSASDPEPVRTSYSCMAALLKTDDVYLLEYSEPSSDDMVGGQVAIGFSENKSDTVYWERNNGNHSLFVLCEQILCDTAYNTPLGSFDMRILGLRVENRLTASGGTLVFEYVSQLRGFDAQTIKMNIEVTIIQ